MLLFQPAALMQLGGAAPERGFRIGGRHPKFN